MLTTVNHNYEKIPKELNLLMSLNNPYIIKYNDHFIEYNNLYIVTKYYQVLFFYFKIKVY